MMYKANGIQGLRARAALERDSWQAKPQRLGSMAGRHSLAEGMHQGKNDACRRGVKIDAKGRLAWGQRSLLLGHAAATLTAAAAAPRCRPPLELGLLPRCRVSTLQL